MTDLCLWMLQVLTWHGKLCRHIERVSSESRDIGSRRCAVRRELWMCRKRHGRLIILCPPRESVFPRCTVSYCHNLQGATGHSNVWDAQILLQGLWSYATWMRSNNRPTLPNLCSYCLHLNFNNPRCDLSYLHPTITDVPPIFSTISLINVTAWLDFVLKLKVLIRQVFSQLLFFSDNAAIVMCMICKQKLGILHWSTFWSSLLCNTNVFHDIFALLLLTSHHMSKEKVWTWFSWWEKLFDKIPNLLYYLHEIIQSLFCKVFKFILFNHTSPGFILLDKNSSRNYLFVWTAVFCATFRKMTSFLDH